MNSSFLLQHVHRLSNGEDDIKVIGIYRTTDAAKAAVDFLKKQPGFCDHSNIVNHENEQGFHITEYQLDENHWQEGFVTLPPEE